MTNLEALKGLVGYPLSESTFELALTNRSLNKIATYVVASKKSLELARADCLMTIVSQPNITEGGYSVSLTEKKALIELANGIYSKYGELSSLKNTVKIVSRW